MAPVGLRKSCVLEGTTQTVHVLLFITSQGVCWVGEGTQPGSRRVNWDLSGHLRKYSTLHILLCWGANYFIIPRHLFTVCVIVF